jgi:hypothetical protein
MNKRLNESDAKIVDLREGKREIKNDMDKRFEQVNVKLDTIIESLDSRIDHGLREIRSLFIKLFSFTVFFLPV